MMRFALSLMLSTLLAAQAWAARELRGDDLSEVAAAAERQGVPILLIVSQHACPFCELLKTEIIDPMRISGDYVDKVVMVEILMDAETEIRDFHGNLVRPGVIADAYKVWVTPTLLFLDHTGREIHPRTLGVNTVEMYGHYLDLSLQEALRAVRTQDRSYSPSEADIRGDAGRGRQPSV